jgi:hypothetical protein
MKFSIGDIVLLKRTGEEGRVVGYVNKEMIEVEVGGTHFPVFLDEVDHPYLKWFTEKKAAPSAPKRIEDIPVEKKPAIGQGVASGFHLSFLPVFRFDEFEDVVDKLKTYFINQTAHRLILQYECSSHSRILFSHKAELQPFSHFYLHDIPFDEMHDQPRFSWILEQSGGKNRTDCLSDTLRIKPKKLFEYISRSQQDNSPMFHVRLAEDFSSFPLSAFEEKKVLRESVSTIVTALKNTGKRAKPVQEIDLHIEQLVSDTKGLTNFDMLTIQLDAFELALDNAIRTRQQSLVVIHGVGKGRLKEEIHNLLKSVAEVEFFQHDWNPRYGYGATEIFFRQ